MLHSELLLTPIYSILGCDAELAGVFGTRHSIRAIDRTRGVPVTQNGIETGTLAPAAAVKAADLAANHIKLGDLPGSMLTLNGKQWNVTAAAPLSSADGEEAGQVIIFLSEFGDE